VPDGYESNNSDTDKRLSNRRTSTAAKHSTKEGEDSTSENDGSGSEADNQPGTNPGKPGGPIEATDPEGKGLAPEAAKVAKTGPKKERKRRNQRGKKKSVPLIKRSDGGDEEEDNTDVAMVMRVLHYHYLISHLLIAREGLPRQSIRWR
jgi:hypothetical protein